MTTALTGRACRGQYWFCRCVAGRLPACTLVCWYKLEKRIYCEQVLMKTSSYVGNLTAQVLPTNTLPLAKDELRIAKDSLCMFCLFRLTWF